MKSMDIKVRRKIEFEGIKELREQLYEMVEQALSAAAEFSDDPANFELGVSIYAKDD